ISNPTIQEIYELRQRVTRSIRDFLDKEGFLEFDPIMIAPSTDPGIRGAVQFSINYYGREYKITTSGIMYKQILASLTKRGKIYFLYPNVRGEPSEAMSTGRHLAEFVQVDLEMRDADHFEAMSLAERILKSVFDDLKAFESSLRDIWSFFGSDRRALPDLRLPIEKITHREAVELCMEYSKDEEVLSILRSSFGVERPEKRLSFDQEIPWEWEWFLSKLFKAPFFIYDYPKSSRGFYDREYPDKRGILMDFDLLAPEGHGEIASGGAREYEADRIRGRIHSMGEDPERYAWFIDFMRKFGKPSAGFGIGLERLLKYICDAPHVLFVRPFPRVPGLHTP
ncbi:MAG: asparagine synthetase A, partial [Candidatus Korarchaeum sp.]|nr:asparagine synthetase A [Candidatus Korarchaeum sp.]MDW8035950.1 asparagine synthetase A [Candidatus Korarchaeum sp.]